MAFPTDGDPGTDTVAAPNDWGTKLIASLEVEHNADGTHNFAGTPNGSKFLGDNRTWQTIPAMTPASHASSHQTGGTDIISVDSSMISSGAATAGYVLAASGGGAVTWQATPAGAALSSSVTQSSHGFAVGDVIRYSGSTYTKARADSAANAEVTGIVSAVANANTFTLFGSGMIGTLSGLTAGTVYFLSAGTAGAVTTTEPTTPGQVSKPVMFAVSTTSALFYNMRGIVVPYSARVCLPVNLPGVTLGTGTGLAGFRVDSSLTGKKLYAVEASVVTASSSGLPTFAVNRLRGGASASMLSTNITIDATEYDTSTAATPAAVNSSNATVQTGDVISVDCTVAGTGAKGAAVTLLIA